MGVFEICAIGITLAFIVLVIFIASTLVTVKKTLVETNETVKHLQVKAESLSSQSIELINNVNLITANMRQQLDTLTPLFQSVEDIGLAMKGFTKSLRDQDYRFTPPKKSTWQDKLLEGVELAGLAANVWKSFQKEKFEDECEEYQERRKWNGRLLRK